MSLNRRYGFCTLSILCSFILLQAISSDRNGSLSTVDLSQLPETLINSFSLRNQRTLSTTSLPLTGIPNPPSDSAQSPFPLSFSSTTSNSPLASALLFSVLGADLRPMIPQLTNRFRASSCQPSGRPLWTSSEPGWPWPESARTEEDGPLDLSNKSPNPRLESPSEPVSCRNVAATTPVPLSVPVPSVQDSSESEAKSIPIHHDEKSPIARRRRTAVSRRSRKPVRQKHHLNAKQNSASQSEELSTTDLFPVTQLTFQPRFPVLSDTEDYKFTTSSDKNSNNPRVRGRRSHSASDTPLARVDKPNRTSDEAAGSDVSTISESHWSINRPTALTQPRRTSSSSGVNTSRPGSDPNICNPRMRRYPEMTPTEAKDQAYWEKRVKNNEAARRSRRARKSKEQSLRDYAERLEKVNTQLLEEIKLLKKEVVRLKSASGEKNGAERE
ncbi:putative par domain protein [Fasciolopsis buskii]|uniref:Putative par domain protein n=1 Tax=Fasciolopsis buskii TaxID=27845 RepID=A0A8E0RUZ8_9TREM|nr:putative par domain protein [Fasciolopsis buski]